MAAGAVSGGWPRLGSVALAAQPAFRDPKVRGCGVGDIRAMLETGNLGGKCADLNALFVRLARAAGLPPPPAGASSLPNRLRTIYPSVIVP